MRLIWPDAGGLQSVEAIARRIQERGSLPLAGLGMQPGDPEYTKLRQAAVLIPLLWDHDHWRVLFTRRAETLNHHKGQVSFPGGRAEREDRSLIDTALREAFEEIALPAEAVLVLGQLNPRPTISGFVVTPVVGQIRWPSEFQIYAQEVSRVFTIPLAWLADPANHEMRNRLLPTGTYEDVIYFRPYDDEIVWGATARFTIDLLRVLDLIE